MPALLEPQPPQPPIIPDSALMQRLAQRDSTALVELERRYFASLYAQAYAVLVDADAAERVVHAAFTQLWFEAARGRHKLSAGTLLRDIAKELTRAERELHKSNGHGS